LTHDLTLLPGQPFIWSWPCPEPIGSWSELIWTVLQAPGDAPGAAQILLSLSRGLLLLNAHTCDPSEGVLEYIWGHPDQIRIALAGSATAQLAAGEPWTHALDEISLHAPRRTLVAGQIYLAEPAPSH